MIGTFQENVVEQGESEDGGGGGQEGAGERLKLGWAVVAIAAIGASFNVLW